MVKVSYFVLALVFSIYQAKKANGINCLTCQWPINNDECFSSPNNDSVNSLSCSYSEAQNPYCQTIFNIEDGIIVYITRGCQTGVFDEDVTTQSMPTEEKCVTSLSSSLDAVDKTTCYFSCNNEDDCNTIVPQSLQLCAINCGPYGSCDYITGKCRCEPGYSGDDCRTQDPPPVQTFRQCVQCDSEMDSSCLEATETSICPKPNQQYCAVSHIMTFDEDDKIVRDFVVRSCTESFVVSDECFISDRSDVPLGGDIEYTCVTTCDTDSCNTGLPDGLADNENLKQPLRCVVCDSSDGNWNDCASRTSTTICSSSDSYCLSTVSYLLSDKTDLPYNAEPNFEPLRIVRNCASSSVTRECQAETISSSTLKKVTCSESCQNDGCNTGWPARPLCSQCSCDHCTSDDTCVQTPPEPTQCNMPYHNFCTIHDVSKRISNSNAMKGYPRSLVRSCSYKGIGNYCEESQYNALLENCNKSCTDDGCNLGFSELASTIPLTATEKSTTTTADANIPSSGYSLFISLVLIWIKLINNY